MKEIVPPSSNPDDYLTQGESLPSTDQEIGADKGDPIYTPPNVGAVVSEDPDGYLYREA